MLMTVATSVSATSHADRASRLPSARTSLPPSPLRTLTGAPPAHAMHVAYCGYDRLHQIGVGRAHKGKRVTMLVNGLDVRVISLDGELLRHLQLDPTRDYQPQGS
jgi:hypothetical protein